MNINIKLLRNFTALLLGVVFCFSFLSASSVNAQPIMQVCKDKKRPEACSKAVKETCKSRSTPDSISRCQKARAGDFKDAPGTGGGIDLNAKASTGGGRCGNEKSGSSIETRFDFNCLGNKGPVTMGPIEDLVYALVRFLSFGVGVVIIGSIILAGIQYSSSEGNPETTQAAKNRIKDSIIGLFIYLLAFAIVQYLVPGGVFTGIMVPPGVPPDIIRIIL